MNVVLRLSALVLALVLAACAKEPVSDAAEHAPTAPAGATQTVEAKPTIVRDAIDKALPPLTVYKSPRCDCCEAWVEHLRAAGFQVAVKDTEVLGAIKSQAGVPHEKGSCHTSRVGDYIVEGYVPADDIKRLLMEMPDAFGLMVTGAITGAPKVGSGTVRQPYDVMLLAKDGTRSVFSHHNQ